MLTIIFGITTLVCGIGWLAAKISIRSLLIFMYERYNSLPTDEEIRIYTQKAADQMFIFLRKEKR